MGTAAAFEWARRPTPPARVLPMPKAPHFVRTFDATSFSKGNLHAHTNRSDGDAPPEEVIGWYRRNGYAFLAITDHNLLTTATSYPELQDAAFKLVSGEEVSMRAGGRQVHVNSLCTEHPIGGGNFASSAEALAWATTRIASAGGVALVNHPNFDRAIDARDLLAAGPASLLEIMSGHPYVYSNGKLDRPSHEALWDYALGEGARFMAAAVDDLHHLQVDADPPAFAGRAWVDVFGTRNDSIAVCEALRQGNLYASNGPSIRRIDVTQTTYTVWPAEAGATVTFIGKGGRVLEAVGPLAVGAAASHSLSRADGYVRSKVAAPDGSEAWTPAVFESE